MKGAILAIVLVLGTCLIIQMPMKVKGDTIQLNWIKTDTDFKLGGGQSMDGYLRVNESDVITVNWKDGFIAYGYKVHIYICSFDIALNYNAINYSAAVTAGLQVTTSLWSQLGFPYTYAAVSNDSSGHYDGLTNPLSSPQEFWIEVVRDVMLYISIDVAQTLGPQTFNVTVTPDNNSINNQVKNLTNTVSVLNEIVTDLFAELYSTQAQINVLSDQLSQLTMNETSDYARLEALIQSIDSSLGQNITDLWTALSENDTDLMSQLVSNITNLTDQLSLLNSTLNHRISNIPKYNDTPIWDELNAVKRPINATYLNQTVVNQTVVNKTEVQPIRYINKTVETNTPSAYIASTGLGVVGGIIGGFIIATILIRRKKPDIVNTKNVEPHEVPKK
jgi:hypothetical protein